MKHSMNTGRFSVLRMVLRRRFAQNYLENNIMQLTCAVLEKLLGGKKGFVELHEIWLIKEYRGEGYGEMFYDFFEKFMKGKGYSDIIYADNPAALAICRKRGYKEGEYLKGAKEYVFYLSLK